MVFDNPLPLIATPFEQLSYVFFTIIIVALSITMLLCIYTEHLEPSHWYDVAKDEYNFMQSEESEQSRLDLAQAFIDLNQHKEASNLLTDLLKSSNPIIKEKARQLLNQLPH